jgi:Mn-dependent DtxR family transcriptional regulator
MKYSIRCYCRRHFGRLLESDETLINYNKLHATTLMPVRLEDHDPGIGLTPGTTKSDIVEFLYSNLEYGYKPAEIQSALDIPHGTATTTLKRLYDDDYIGKTADGYYFALEDKEEMHRYLSSLDQAMRMFGHHISGSSAADPDAGVTGATTVVNERDLDAELDELESEIEQEG